ncbi:phage virion morphogenesis protein [Bosea minatitlanensis]|uniref:Phage virion morphogenesis protein n=1 Tax=Bosea minatitlanensis TaxID=128782 RepID=A0ABW0EYQ3_9HYPH|nr:phage virion morphogenesis protein [Bosea minatitlanensis]MCT4491804.1 phage virion morphogenesis protein [Bosea minatitlanensis]
MSALAIEIELSGFAQVEQFFARLNPFESETLLEAMARLIRESTRERIIAGGPAPDGSAWKPNRVGRTPILHLSGALARSIDYVVAGTRAVIGSGLVYARIHQEGGVIVPKSASALVFSAGNRLFRVKKVTMPARPYVGLSGEDRAELVQTAVEYLRRLFK